MLALLFLACESESSPCEDPPYTLGWGNFGDGFMADYCRACHAAQAVERFEAPEEVNFDTEADVVRWGERIRVRVLDEASMPVGGGVTSQDAERLDLYLSCTLGL